MTETARIDAATGTAWQLVSPIIEKPTAASESLTAIEKLDRELEARFARRLSVQPTLTRALVSFQANKSRAAYRWYKYKEAFSASLVETLLQQHGVSDGIVLDPFAGSGTALFAARELGLDADGIELLPIGQEIIAARRALEDEFTASDFAELKRWSTARPWRNVTEVARLPELRITKGAYPPAALAEIQRFLAALPQASPRVRQVLRFALFCVLESVSFTRKDGQYLRWDDRSGRRVGKKPCHKGPILDFNQAICGKINEIVADVENGSPQAELFPTEARKGALKLYNGSCLDILPALPADFYNAVITSPPYCNRYDYTRTYALELALLDMDERGLVALRQAMLSCTVENRAKDLLQLNPAWRDALAAADGQKLLQAILRYLEQQKEQGALNNNGIPRMLRGYFYEMAGVIAECARVLKTGAPLLMVNDNVRYAGASVSVDLILSDLAEQLGFAVENILVLPNGKGNSSQQMGAHGREALRKCIYVWRKR
jgi:DNA modification methylase